MKVTQAKLALKLVKEKILWISRRSDTIMLSSNKFCECLCYSWYLPLGFRPQGSRENSLSQVLAAAVGSGHNGFSIICFGRRSVQSHRHAFAVCDEQKYH